MRPSRKGDMAIAPTPSPANMAFEGDKNRSMYAGMWIVKDSEYVSVNNQPLTVSADGRRT
jgi:hypothetical protein